MTSPNWAPTANGVCSGCRWRRTSSSTAAARSPTLTSPTWSTSNENRSSTSLTSSFRPSSCLSSPCWVSTSLPTPARKWASISPVCSRSSSSSSSGHSSYPRHRSRYRTSVSVWSICFWFDLYANCNVGISDSIFILGIRWRHMPYTTAPN